MWKNQISSSFYDPNSFPFSSENPPLIIAKISDFGHALPSNIESESNKMIPWKQSAPEVLKQKFDTSANQHKSPSQSFRSDVWSFGIAIWELFATLEKPPKTGTAFKRLN